MKKAAPKPKSSPPRRKPGDKAKQQAKPLNALAGGNATRLRSELSAHKIEPETQNEELRRAQGELAASRRKYADLYDFAPIGYFTFDGRGLIHDVNQTGAVMLG